MLFYLYLKVYTSFSLYIKFFILYPEVNICIRVCSLRMTKKYDRRLNVGSEHEFGSSDSEDESDDDFDEFNGSEEEDFF